MLRTPRCFASFPQPELEILERSAQAWHYLRGETIAERGDVPPGIWIVASGNTTSHRSTPNGKYFLQGVLWPGDMFGLMPIIDGWPMPLSHSARRNSLIVFIPRAALMETLRDTERLRSFSHHICMSTRVTYESVFSANVDSLTCRVAKHLAYLPRRSIFMEAPDNAAWIDPAPIDLTQDELASMLGVARQTLNRTLVPFLRQGIVVRDGEEIRVTNFRKLIPYMEENEPLIDVWRNEILSWDERIKQGEPPAIKARGSLQDALL